MENVNPNQTTATPDSSATPASATPPIDATNPNTPSNTPADTTATPVDPNATPSNTPNTASTPSTATPDTQNMGAPMDGTANADGQGLNTSNPQPVQAPTADVPTDAVKEMPADNAAIYSNQAPGVAIAQDPQGNGIVPIPAKSTEPLTVTQENGKAVYSRPLTQHDVLESQGLTQVVNPDTGMTYQLTQDQVDSKMKELKALQSQLGL